MKDLNSIVECLAENHENEQNEKMRERILEDKELLETCAESVVDAICIIASRASLIDGMKEGKMTLALLNDLSVVREVLKKLSRQVMNGIGFLFMGNWDMIMGLFISL